jgi:hypothetical protein
MIAANSMSILKGANWRDARWVLALRNWRGNAAAVILRLKGSRTVRADRTRSAGWIGDGAAFVTLSQAEKWGWLRTVSGEIVVVPPIGGSFTSQCGGVCSVAQRQTLFF